MSSPHPTALVATRGWNAFFVLVVLAAMLPGCERGKTAVSAKAPAGPPPAVMVTEVVQKTVPIYLEFVARTDAVETVEIRARVQAYLQGQHFQEGTVVRKDQVLFTLDKQQYEAQLRQARGQLAKAKADLAFAQEKATVETAKANLDVAIAGLAKADQDVTRLKPLAEKQAVPKRDFDNAIVGQQSAQADVASRKAALETAIANQKAAIEQAQGGVEQAQGGVELAELNLGYCTIRSPITGLIGERKVAPGNLVGRGDATLLDTVSSLDPIRAYVAVSETEYLTFMAMRKNAKADLGRALDLILADGSVFPHKGRMVIADRAVDERTGTLSLIAEFPNPDGLLRPGQFGRVRIAGRTVENALLVPQRAVTELQDSTAVYVVGPDNKVAMRTVEVTDRIENFFIVTGGVKAGERIIVEGLLKVRPGILVQPTSAPAPAQQPIESKKR
ncbi:MAG TPA: efflux RND transporter periplasmic adaptor subunit [Candidatus Methylomirabilis sp.]|nr:efflux RND transporter periplasmic adaptor subunit [Candidatus Methylomirabilis sp.]